MKPRTVRDIEWGGRRVLLRVDLNVPLKEGRVQEDTRIREALPTLRYLLEQGASVVILSHVGRPKGRQEALSLAPVAARLSELLGRPVPHLQDCIGPQVEAACRALRPGEAVLLENLRFHPEEEKNDEGFAAGLAALGDAYVNDGFGVSHRAHASVHALPRRFERRCAGFLLEKEISALSGLLENPAPPFVAVLGGAKVSDKIPALRNLVRKVHVLLIGGAMAYTFIRAMGFSVGKSRVEDDSIPDAKEVLQEARDRGVKLLLPQDHRVVLDFQDPSKLKILDGPICGEWVGVDIGPKTAFDYSGECVRARTIFWNGPLGAFETPEYARGTIEVARAVAACAGTKVIGGGDTISAAAAAGVKERMSHVSTGGGACLEFLEGKTLPGIAALAA